MSDSNVPSVPLDPNQTAAQNATFGNIQGMSAATPQFQGVFNSQATNPGVPGAQAGAQAGGAALTGQGDQNLGTSASMAGAFPTLLPFMQQALQTGFDPQNALKGQLGQQSRDTTNQDLASRGLQYSPFGAGVASTQDQLFNTNWLQSQLNREQTGANTANTLLGAGVNTAQAGAGLGNTGAKQLAEGGALPYMTNTGINQDLASFLPYLTQNQQQMIQDLLHYGSNANQTAGVAVQAGQAQDKADQAFGSGIGGALSTLFGGQGIFGMAGAGAGLLAR